MIHITTMDYESSAEIAIQVLLSDTNFSRDDKDAMFVQFGMSYMDNNDKIIVDKGRCNVSRISLAYLDDSLSDKTFRYYDEFLDTIAPQFDRLAMAIVRTDIARSGEFFEINYMIITSLSEQSYGIAKYSIGSKVIYTYGLAQLMTICAVRTNALGMTQYILCDPMGETVQRLMMINNMTVSIPLWINESQCKLVI